jgi:hypothetical protein
MSAMAQERSLLEIGRSVMNQMSEFVGCPAEGITGIQKLDGGWIVTVELLEMARVPETTDVLGSYDVHVDPEGRIIDFQRGPRYLRAEVGTG